MQAIELLNDSQVNDFLSGKTPLNLSMRLNEHLIMIQLQLSTVNPTNPSASTTATGSTGSINSSRTRSINRSKSSSSAHSSSISSPIKFTNANQMYKSLSSDQIPEKYRHRHEDVSPQPSTSRAAELVGSTNELKEHRTVDSSIADENGENKTIVSIDDSDLDMNASLTNTEGDALLEQLPSKSLSNLVTAPMKNIPMSIPTSNNTLTSWPCSCKSVVSSSSSAPGCDMNCQYSQTHHQLQLKKNVNVTEPKTATRSSTLLHKTLNNPIVKAKSSGFQSNQRSARSAGAEASNLRRSKSSDNISLAEKGMCTAKSLPNDLSVDQSMNMNDTTTGNSLNTTANVSDTLAESSRNLTKNLHNLSNEVISSKSNASAIAINDEKRMCSCNRSTPAKSSGSHQSSTVAGFGSGTVIESFRSHGRGIFSGTFSGTLNPALQDRNGRPKRDISTVIHILNDLLCATPHYNRGSRISIEPAHHSRKYVSVLNLKI